MKDPLIEGTWGEGTLRSSEYIKIGKPKLLTFTGGLAGKSN